MKIFESRILEIWHPELGGYLECGSFGCLKKGNKFRMKEGSDYVVIKNKTEFIAEKDSYLVKYEDIGYTYQVEIEDS